MKTAGFGEVTKVLSRDSKLEGTPTGGSRPCQLEGCRGLRIAVRWPDKSITYPCTKGLDSVSGTVVRIA
jgi:hypothetical protein